MIEFVDASAVIYLIEGSAPFADRTRAELKLWARKHPHANAAVSRLG